MLLNLSKKAWAAGLTLGDYDAQRAANAKTVDSMKGLAARCALEAGPGGAHARALVRLGCGRL